MTDKHTPGPWKPEGTLIWAPDAKANIAQVSELRTDDYVSFTTPSGSSPDFHEIVANARLIAAAPALLEALEETKSALNGVPCSCNDDRGCQRCHAGRKATDAIKAAK